MDYSDLKQAINSYSERNLEERKNWYSPAAEAYNKARPQYPKELIRQVIESTQLSSSSKVLEVGCGPATATVGFAQLGTKMVCLEPNPDFYQLAKQNCTQHSNIEIQNISFEEWKLEADSFDAVLAASSFHWIPQDVAYLKSAQALKANGYLILLWNKELQPSYEVYQRLSHIYQLNAPSLNRYEDRETQKKILQGLGQIVEDSGLFKDLVTGHVESELTYTADEYLTLLNTYSPYLKLAHDNKETLFKGLRDIIENDLCGRLQLSYISAFHIAKKC